MKFSESVHSHTEIVTTEHTEQAGSSDTTEGSTNGLPMQPRPTSEQTGARRKTWRQKTSFHEKIDLDSRDPSDTETEQKGKLNLTHITPKETVTM